MSPRAGSSRVRRGGCLGRNLGRGVQLDKSRSTYCELVWFLTKVRLNIGGQGARGQRGEEKASCSSPHCLLEHSK